jgi:hypothetical protein
MSLLKTLSIGGLAAVALALTAIASHAQLAKDTPAKAPAATTAKKATKAAVSACQGLAQAACVAKASDCRWIAATKRKDGKQVSAYCRSVPKAKAKTAAKKTATTTKKAAPKAKAAPPPAPSK